MNTRTLTSILGNSQRLDGGAMFGNAPRVLWQRWIVPDEQNRIPLACRCLLVRDGTRTILLETGIGTFFAPPMRDRFGVMEERHVLIDSLAAVGVAPGDIDVVVLSHLHFDHAGGALTTWREGLPHELIFPRATFVVSHEGWKRALAPHSRDRASFVPELNALLAASGRLEIIDLATTKTSAVLGAGFRFHDSSGHTPGLMLTEIDMPAGPVLFASDLIPGIPWVHVPITMGYDRYAELIIDEKASLLADLVSRGGRLFFTHDPQIALSTVTRDDKGKFSTRDDHAHVVSLAA